MQAVAQFTVESHTADGIQGSELAARVRVHAEQMGVDEQTKKLRRGLQQWHEQPWWKEE